MMAERSEGPAGLQGASAWSMARGTAVGFGLLERFAQRRAMAKFSRSPIGQALRQHTENDSILRHFSADVKQDVINQLDTSIAEIIVADNPFLMLRQELGGFVHAYSNFQVLCLLPDEKLDLHFTKSPYISGKLNTHILRCAQHNTELKELLWREPDRTPQSLTTYCNVGCAKFAYFLNGYDILRRFEFNDFEPTPDKDWLRPFVTSMLIFCENFYRGRIGLPSLLPGPLDSLIHGSFMARVVNGDKNPLFEWETQNQLVHAKAIRGLMTMS
jgi:hypothetical protein